MQRRWRVDALTDIFYQIEVRRLQGQEYLLDIQLFRIKKIHMLPFLERSGMPTTEMPFKT
jgi:hypothetical protein